MLRDIYIYIISQPSDLLSLVLKYYCHKRHLFVREFMPKSQLSVASEDYQVESNISNPNRTAQQVI